MNSCVCRNCRRERHAAIFERYYPTECNAGDAVALGILASRLLARVERLERQVGSTAR